MSDLERESVMDMEVLPVAVVRRSALEHNVAAFASYCRSVGADYAPHIKTTMCRVMFDAQREAGAWAATVANVTQARWLRSWECPRIVIANQVVDRVALDWVVDQADNGDCEIYFWVDSRAGIDAAEAARARAGAGAALRVLVEVGHRGGRTGCRSLDLALDIARAVSGSPALELHGVACFEGLVAPAEAGTVVPGLLSLAEAAVAGIREEGLAASERLIVTAGGSAYFDRVVETFGALPQAETRVVLRSGCYVVHDDGFYENVSPLGRVGGTPLRAALEIWSVVHSTPEPGLAIAGFGKRDVGVDMGMPRPLHLRREGETVSVPEQLVVTALNDQHAHIADPGGLLRVGDLLGVGVSHPCTTLDKWSRLAMVDDGNRLIEWVDTSFTRHDPAAATG